MKIEKSLGITLLVLGVLFVISGALGLKSFIDTPHIWTIIPEIIITWVFSLLQLIAGIFALITAYTLLRGKTLGARARK